MKKGDTVIVIAGKEKGKKGVVARVLRSVDRVVVEGINLTKRHSRPRTAGAKGGIIEFPAPLHISNVKIAEAKTEKPAAKKKSVKKGEKKAE